MRCARRATHTILPGTDRYCQGHHQGAAQHGHPVCHQQRGNPTSHGPKQRQGGIIRHRFMGHRGGHQGRKEEDTTATNDNGGNDKQLGGSSMVRIATTAGSSKCQVWPPTDHFEKLLEEACPNHAYPVKHKLRDCSMMKNVMALGSITRGMQFDEVPNVGDATPLPSEDSVMMIYDGCPSPRMCRVSNPSPGTPICCD
jgi:hypothetical protein